MIRYTISVITFIIICCLLLIGCDTQTTTKDITKQGYKILHEIKTMPQVFIVSKDNKIYILDYYGDIQPKHLTNLTPYIKTNKCKEYKTKLKQYNDMKEKLERKKLIEELKAELKKEMESETIYESDY